MGVEKELSAEGRRGRAAGGWERTNREADFHGQKRSNETHGSTTDPEARLYRKGPGKEAKLCFMGHALMENRNVSSVCARACLCIVSVGSLIPLYAPLKLVGVSGLAEGCLWSLGGW